MRTTGSSIMRTTGSSTMRKTVFNNENNSLQQ
jgi:hypothetical protein